MPTIFPSFGMPPSNQQCLLSLSLLLTTLFTCVLTFNVVSKSTLIDPFSCSNYHNQTCNSYLYHISRGLQVEEIASFYSVNTSQVKPTTHGTQQDYLVSVPCTCRDVYGTHGYFYDTFYKVQPGDTFANVTGVLYSGQAWEVVGEEEAFVAGDVVSIHLVCGCVELESREVVVTYTVQEDDTLTEIAALLSANMTRIENLNGRLTQNPSFIDVGWVLFVPMEQRGIQAPKKGLYSIHAGKGRNWTVIIGVLSVVLLFVMGTLILFLLRRIRKHKRKEEDPKAVTKSPGVERTLSLQEQFHKNDIEDMSNFESERPVLYSVEEIDAATSNFDETKKIGEGGYGSVYFCILGGREVAIKKMKSSRSKEFFAELKVLCKIHHINVVELLGYASGENHLYLGYEYVLNGSLNEHLHDPLLKGHPSLSWTARAHIALDAARGIEYIHDHTKAQYVHRDIKTSNILLDHGLRAKVADFGLARLVERSNAENFIATRLVGTPGYIPPESVSELQVTSKTDVFAFGVVLSELITGQRALSRDNQEPNRTKTLISVMYKIFTENDSETALEAHIDGNLRGIYPAAEVYKMAEIARQCLNEEAVNRPEMREVVQRLSQILMCSIEWEASLGGDTQVFSGLLTGR